MADWASVIMVTIMVFLLSVQTMHQAQGLFILTTTLFSIFIFWTMSCEPGPSTVTARSPNH